MEFIAISYQLAYDAYRGISFSPEKRAESTVKGFQETLESTYSEMKELCKTDKQLVVLDQEFQRFQEGYANKYRAWLGAKSRCLSSMITGPARFPTRRNEKANNSEHKRSEECTLYYDRGVKAMRKKIHLAKDQAQLDQEAKEAEKKNIDFIYTRAGEIMHYMVTPSGYSIQLLKQSLVRKIINMLGHDPELMEEVVNQLNKTCKETTKRVFFQKRHLIFKAIEERKAKKEEEAQGPKEDVELYKCDDFRIVNCIEDERIRFFFDGKPDPEVRSIMKDHAFRWSPNAEAWQRKNTGNGIYNAKLAWKLLKKFYEKE